MDRTVSPHPTRWKGSNPFSAALYTQTRLIFNQAATCWAVKRGSNPFEVFNSPPIRSPLSIPHYAKCLKDHRQCFSDLNHPCSFPGGSPRYFWRYRSIPTGKKTNKKPAFFALGKIQPGNLFPYMKFAL